MGMVAVYFDIVPVTAIVPKWEFHRLGNSGDMVAENTKRVSSSLWGPWKKPRINAFFASEPISKGRRRLKFG
jgi:hypothetical protein